MELSSNNLILVTKHYIGDLTQGFDGLCFERPARSKCQRAQQVSARAASAQQVSARGKSACPRATCERRARSLGSCKPLLGGLGVSV